MAGRTPFYQTQNDKTVISKNPNDTTMVYRNSWIDCRDEKTAADLAHAYNVHDELVSALEDIRDTGDQARIYQIAMDALAKVKVKA